MGSMAFNNLSLGQRISEEYQLLAEEKWIIEAITKLKNQRNCLQIERLHLESLKLKARSKGMSTTSSQVSDKQDPLATTSGNNLQHEMAKSGVLSDVVQIRLEDESTCNKQELNLNITNPVFNIKQNTDFNMEQDEEEFESDEENNVEIDINMLMNGIFQ